MIMPTTANAPRAALGPVHIVHIVHPLATTAPGSHP